MKKKLIAIFASMFCFGCSAAATEEAWKTITAVEAQEMMETETDYIILDVRTEDEYNTGHVPKAICLPYDAINKETTSDFKTDQLILVYCRSGNRSKKACASLSDLGFTNVVDFGGIGDWTGKIVK